MGYYFGERTSAAKELVRDADSSVLYGDFDERDVSNIALLYGLEKKDQKLPTPSGLVAIFGDLNDYGHGYYSELFYKDGKLWENQSSHCSCRGCEDQWNPLEISLAELKRRPNGYEGVPFEVIEKLSRDKGYKGD